MTFLSPGDFPNPGIEHWSPSLQADCLPYEPTGKPCHFKIELCVELDGLEQLIPLLSESTQNV